jgi:Fe-Mn family superoxide dismutase
MKKYEEKKFEIPTDLKGVSQKTMEEHLKLYSGYVKNSNLILDKIGELMADHEANAFVLGELQRRFAFEFCGMRNHEYYFSSFEGGPKPLTKGTALKAQIEKQAPSFDIWLQGFKFIATTRGVGWAIMGWDTATQQLTHSWVDEQHVGHLTGLQPVLMLDMWEHSYIADYQPSGKKQYIEDFFANLNWEIIEKNFAEAAK